MVLSILGVFFVCWNGALAHYYAIAIRSVGVRPRQTFISVAFLSSYLVAYTIFLLRNDLLAAASILVISSVHFVACRNSPSCKGISEHVLKNLLPQSEGPRAVAILVAFANVICMVLLWLSRETPFWGKLLFATSAPISNYFAVSLMALAASRSR